MALFKKNLLEFFLNDQFKEIYFSIFQNESTIKITFKVFFALNNENHLYWVDKVWYPCDWTELRTWRSNLHQVIGAAKLEQKNVLEVLKCAYNYMCIEKVCRKQDEFSILTKHLKKSTNLCV